MLRDKYFYSRGGSRGILKSSGGKVGVPLYNPAPLPRNISQGNYAPQDQEVRHLSFLPFTKSRQVRT